MLSIRMQRTGRKGHAMFRVVVQESRLTPTSGKVVATLGSYDPHAKTVQLDAEKASFYLKNGAQPSDRAAVLLKKEGVKLPKWVKLEGTRSGKIRNPEKLRRDRPKEEASDESPVEASNEEAPVESTEEVAVAEPAAAAEEASAEEAAEENAPETETGTVEA